MNSAWIGLVGVVIGGALAGAVSFLTSERDRRFQRQRDRLNDKRAMRDQKRARVVGAMKSLLVVSAVMQNTLIEMNVLMDGETVESRNARLNRSLSEASRSLLGAQIELDLAGGFDEALQLFRRMFDAFGRYQRGLSSNKEWPGTTRLDELQRERETLNNEIAKLIDLCKEKVGLLDTAI